MLVGMAIHTSALASLWAFLLHKLSDGLAWKLTSSSKFCGCMLLCLAETTKNTHTYLVAFSNWIFTEFTPVRIMEREAKQEKTTPLRPICAPKCGKHSHFIGWCRKKNDSHFVVTET